MEKTRQNLLAAIDGWIPRGASVVVVLVAPDGWEVTVGSNEASMDTHERAQACARAIEVPAVGSVPVNAEQVGWVLAAADRMGAALARVPLRDEDLEVGKLWGLELERRLVALGFDARRCMVSMARNVKATRGVVPVAPEPRGDG